ncbi:hypothetical protein Tco_0355399 [Tanacetum coccineum]
MDWGEVNPVHAYYNGSCTSKDNEDPRWSTSFKTRRTQKNSQLGKLILEDLYFNYDTSNADITQDNQRNKGLGVLLVGIKSLLDADSINVALIDVNAAQSNLVLLENFNENYSKCLRLLVKLQLLVRS